MEADSQGGGRTSSTTATTRSGRWKQILKVAVALMLVALVWKLVAGDETTETGVDE